MATEQDIYNITCSPGIKRDGTEFEGNYYVDAQWCRWQRGLPRKMGGYSLIRNDVNGLIRGDVLTYAKDRVIYAYAGANKYLNMSTLNYNGAPGTIYDVTPSGLAQSDDNIWQMAAIYNPSGTKDAVIVHAAPNMDIASSVETEVFIGDITSATPPVSFPGTAQFVSGGCVALWPQLFLYGNGGMVKWSKSSDITDFVGGAASDAGNARIAQTKIIKGYPIRGGSDNAPSGLFWSLDSIHRISYVGGDSIYRSDILAVDTSLLSTSCVVDYDGIIYWIAQDRFMMYNGTVREVQNTMNLNFFFDNLNRAYAQKCYAFKSTRWGEIWYCFPYGDATECNWAIVQNIREGTWYDTPLPEGGMSAGSFTQVLARPITFGINEVVTDKYEMWQLEYGVDRYYNSETYAIKSYFETSDISWAAMGPQNVWWQGFDKWVRLLRVEPDFIQTGDMMMYVKGRSFAQSPGLITSGPYIYSPSAPNNKIDTRVQYRQLRLLFESNVQGGDYQTGQILLKMEKGDGRS